MIYRKTSIPFDFEIALAINAFVSYADKSGRPKNNFFTVAYPCYRVKTLILQILSKLFIVF